MKKILLASVSLSALTGVAFAADLPSRKEAVVPPPPPPMWQGMYAGLNAGYNWGTNTNVQSQNWAASPWSIAGAGAGGAALNLPTWAPASMDGWGSNTQSGFIGGAQFGYNYQYGSNIVLGVETDIQGTGIRGMTRVGGVAQSGAAGLYGTSTSTAAGATYVNAGVDFLGTVRGRIGYLWNPSLMVYGTGGFTYGGVYAQVAQSAYESISAVTGGGSTVYNATWTGQGSQNQILTGWNAGAGAEWMFMPNWSLKGEALYWDLGRMNVNTASYAVSPAPASILNNNIGWGRTSVNYSGVQAKVGINYHFNWAAPVVAKF